MTRRGVRRMWWFMVVWVTAWSLYDVTALLILARGDWVLAYVGSLIVLLLCLMAAGRGLARTRDG